MNAHTVNVDTQPEPTTSHYSWCGPERCLPALPGVDDDDCHRSPAWQLNYANGRTNGSTTTFRVTTVAFPAAADSAAGGDEVAAPFVHVQHDAAREGGDLTAAEARQVAAALVAHADIIDGNEQGDADRAADLILGLASRISDRPILLGSHDTVTDLVWALVRTLTASHVAGDR